MARLETSAAARIGLAGLGILLTLALVLLNPWARHAPERPRSERPASTAKRPPGRPSAPAAGERIEGRVARVIDGDTVELEGGRRVRLLGLDTPERRSAFFAEAARACRTLLEGREVRVDVSPSTPRDGYGRTLALIYVGAIFANEQIVAQGLARVYFQTPDEMPDAARDRMVEAQNRAIDARLGLWGKPEALATRAGEKLVSTRFRYHRADCPKLKGPRPRKTAPPATSREAALRAGKSPCRSCNPRRRGPCIRLRRPTG